MWGGTIFFMKREIKICNICLREGDEDTLRFGPWGKKCLNCKNKKKCSCCKEIKLLEDFTKDSSRSDGLNNKCKICSGKRDKQRIRYATEEQKHQRRVYEKKRRNTPNRRMRELFRDSLKRLNISKKTSTWRTLGFTKEEFNSKFPIIPTDHDLDHMIPLSWFKQETPIKISCALPNLQILKSSVNNSKKNFYCDKPSDDQYIRECLSFLKDEYVAIVEKLI